MNHTNTPAPSMRIANRVPQTQPSISLWRTILTMLVLVAGLATSTSAQTFSNFTPVQGPSGTTVTLSDPAFVGTVEVRFNGLLAAAFLPNAGTILTQVPPGATTGRITVTISGTTYTSTADFTVTLPVPSITSFAPVQGPIGSNVNITGQNLNNVTGVLFNGVPSTNVSINSTTSLIAEVPVGATTGRITILSALGNDSTATPFTIITLVQPVITSFSPSSGPVGTTVTILGDNFVSPAQVQSVTFNGVPITVGFILSNTELEVEVPSGATTGRIQVTTANGVATSATDFIVTVQATGFCYNGPNLTQAVVTPTTTPQNFNVPANNVARLAILPPAGIQFYQFSSCNSTGQESSSIVVYQTGRQQASNFGGGPVCPGNLLRGSLNYVSTSRDTIYVQMQDFNCAPMALGGVLTYQLTGRPTGTNLSPSSGPEGTLATITGTGLDLVDDLFFSNTFTGIQSRTPTSITFEVPFGSVTSPISFVIGGIFLNSGLTFTVCQSTGPTITSSTGSNSTCSNAVLVLQGPQGQAGYLWSTGATTQNITVTQSGTYTLQTINGACTSGISAPFRVTVRPAPVATLVYQNDTLVAGPAGATLLWFLNGVSLPTGGSRRFVPTVSGTYSVIAIQQPCRDTATLAITSLAAPLEKSLSLYPNPANDQVVLQGLSVGETLVITNSVGKLVSSSQVVEPNIQLNVNNWPTGVYFLQHGKRKQRLMVQH